MEKEEPGGKNSNQEPEAAEHSPKDLFRSCIGWVVAAVLVLLVPTAILCGDPGKAIVIALFVLFMAAVFTFIACTGWK